MTNFKNKSRRWCLKTERSLQRQAVSDKKVWKELAALSRFILSMGYTHVGGRA